MKPVILFAFALSLGVAAHATDEFNLPPGGSVTVFGPAIVKCERFSHYCKCTESGFSGQHHLEIVLDDQGDSDELGSYETREVCEHSLHNNPACRGN